MRKANKKQTLNLFLFLLMVVLVTFSAIPTTNAKYLSSNRYDIETVLVEKTPSPGGEVSGETEEYNVIGKPEEYVAPKTGRYKIQVWGGDGGNGLFSGSVMSQGGNGGYIEAEMMLTQGDVLEVNVAGAGRTGLTGSELDGYGEGGTGAVHDGNVLGGGGGGRSEVTYKTSILLVAGGGGGGALYVAGGGGVGNQLGSSANYGSAINGGRGGTSTSTYLANGVNAGGGGGGGYQNGEGGKSSQIGGGGGGSYANTSLLVTGSVGVPGANPLRLNTTDRVPGFIRITYIEA